MFKKNVEFIDGNKNLVRLEIKIEKGKFTISGECDGSFGQCYDEINPIGGQKELIDIRKKYHLNDLQAGTPEQMKIVNNFENKDYDYVKQQLRLVDINGKDISAKKLQEFVEAEKKYIEFHKSLGDGKYIPEGIYNTAYIVEYEGKPYEYGTRRLKKDLPYNFEEKLTYLIKSIELKKKNKDLVKNMKLTDEQENKIMEVFENRLGKALAIANFFNLTYEELLEVKEIRYCEFNIQGQIYLVATDDEANKLQEEEIERYIDDVVMDEIPEAYRHYFDYKKFEYDMRSNGRGNLLDKRDGMEEKEIINDEIFYFYRQ